MKNNRVVLFLLALCRHGTPGFLSRMNKEPCDEFARTNQVKFKANLDQSVMARWSEEMQNLVTNLQEQTKLSLKLQANLGSICHGSLWSEDPKR